MSLSCSSWAAGCIPDGMHRCTLWLLGFAAGGQVMALVVYGVVADAEAVLHEAKGWPA